jgi:hypothetical protein
MQYMILIYGDEKGYEKRTDADNQQEFAAYMQYTKELAASGAMRGGAPLKPTATATTLRTKGGKVVTIDGPFAETKEHLGGFYLIDVPDLEQALKWASKCPGVKYGTLEVRPVMEIPGM